jgi:ammonia channel protein AmtB
MHPVVVHWAWGGDYLLKMDFHYHDFAGSGGVHPVSGPAGLVVRISLINSV